LAATAVGLERLDLSGNDVTPQAMPAVALAVKYKSRLSYLALEDNAVKSAGAAVLAAALDPERHAALETVVLAGSEIGSAGAMAVARAVAGLPALKMLNMSGNEITEDTVAEITELLGEERVNLEDNDGDEEDDEDEEIEEDPELNELSEMLATKAKV